MLIFSNGTAFFGCTNGESDVDENGMPIVNEELTTEAPCYIESIGEGRDGSYEEGKYPRGSFTISLDFDSVGDDFAPKRVRLVHERKGDLGVFSIQRIEFYSLTRTIQVWV